ncbi:hypothetical protein RFF05_14815 [Bengtsoniella intestinalis]|uniref:hypothetical protein n=1 Tax=Bengtsoniella intestinalis TaxID=3073143 RepID=UPI00391F2E3D
MSFYVKVKDSTGKYVFIEVTLEIHELFEEERRYNKRIKKEYQRHRTDEEFIEEYMLPNRLHTVSIPEKLAHQHDLKQAQAVIATCTETQQRRFNLHRVMGYSLTEIAKMENCSKVSVKESVDKVIAKLNNLKKDL